jgi:hypothetical protein
MLRLLVGTGLDELQVFRVGHEMVLNRKGLNELKMPGPFVIEGKRSFFGANLAQATWVLGPFRPIAGGQHDVAGLSVAQWSINWPQWVPGKQVLQIGQHQFLVLLFMI